MTPSLGLVYASSGGYGLAGVGWSLAGPVSISRQGDRGLPRYDDRSDWHPEQDRFVFGGSELIPICTITAGACSGALPGEAMPAWSNGWQYFRARIEGAFLRFFWSPDHLSWRIQSKAGANLELGVPLDGSGYVGALERNPSKPEEIYRWHLVRQYDAHGAPDATPPAPQNVIQFRYLQDGNLAYLSDAYYTAPSAAPLTSDLARYAHHVALSYEPRPDRNVSYRSGWLLEQRIRIARVDVTSKPFTGASTVPRQLVRRYHLEYDEATHASLLEGASMEGRCSAPIGEQPDGWLGPTECPRLPRMSLEYQRVAGNESPLADSQAFAFEPFATDVREVEGSPPYTLGSGTSLSALLDVNSDGLPDLVVTNPTEFEGNHGVFFNQGEPEGWLRFARPVSMAVTGVSGVDANVLKLSNANVSALDLDGNGTAELVHMPMVRRYAVFSPAKQGEDWRWQGRPINTASGQDAKINFAQDARRTAVMDVNGDGLADVVVASATEYRTFLALGRYPGGDGQFGHARWIGSDTAEISNEPVAFCTPWSSHAVLLGDPDVRVADMNGDGLPDIVRLRSGQALYWPGRGNGYFGTGERDACPAGETADEQHVAVTDVPRFGTTQPGTLNLADVNGDGLADLVEIRKDAVDVYLNDNGLAFTDRRTLTDVPIRPNSRNPAVLADINGSGSMDVLWAQGHDYQYIDLTGGIRPYLLTKIHNGLGRSTELEYQSSVEHMVDAIEADEPWASTMPLSTPLVVRVTVRDNLERIGRSAGRYVTEYRYRDPVFDGRQREFRGFRSAEARVLGDAAGPTSTVRSTHLLGECAVAQNGHDVCSPGESWRDNWREALKGLPVLTETFNDQGVFLATEHQRYELRQLYTGRDGRRVVVALPTGRQAYAYDTSAFVAATATVSLPEIDVNLTGITQAEARAVPRRATQGTVRIDAAGVHDNYGNVTSSTNFGCVEGCPSVDEAITSHSVSARVPGDTSGWLWRETSSHVTGSVQTQPRHATRGEYDARGDLKRAFATLSGTLALDRFHALGSPVAPAPPNASSGISAAVEIQTASFDHDAFGNSTSMRGPIGRCRTVGFDVDYANLPIQETTFGGPIGASGCGARAFTTTATYDRGLALVATATDARGQPSRFDYDGFGRLVAVTDVDPTSPGQVGSVPSVTYEYVLPNDWTATPYSILVVREQDGGPSAYHEQYHYVDGLQRTLIALSEADPSAGDGGAFVVGGLVHYTAKGAPLRAHENFFWTGNPRAFPLAQTQPLRSVAQQYDAFGREIQSYNIDGSPKLRTVYHALGVDRWDAADLGVGPHANSYATLRSDGHGRQVEAIERVRVGGVLEEHRLLSEYLPSGERRRLIQRRAGSTDVVRWLRYDSLGRLVLNAEPNSSTGFQPDPNTNPSTIRAWRYAYNDAGDLVGTSDARGCGVNYHYDTAGRILAEDHSPCLDHHAAYSAPNFGTETGIEVLHRYDLVDPEASTVRDAAGRTLPTNTSLLWGRASAVSDLGSKTLVAYDARGRITGSARRIVKPGTPSNALASRYAPRHYVRANSFDAANRIVETHTGATSPELMGNGAESALRTAYTARGIVKRTTSSYGTLLDARTVDANGFARTLTFGDAARTQRTFQYDARDRVESVQTFRSTPPFWSNPPPGYGNPSPTEPTQQLLLEDYDFAYDEVNNVTAITDWRITSEWPTSAKPVSRSLEYDDLYRLTRVSYSYATPTDAWTSPFAAENSQLASVANESKPSPHVRFDNRPLQQTYTYDHLGNTKSSGDDANGFFDRSLGTTTQGSVTSGPNQLRIASNRSIAPTGPRRGDLDARYDAAGNLTDLIVRRNGTCLPVGASCWQRFRYDWDEIGQLKRARRWDLAPASPNERDLNGDMTDPLPTRTPNVDLRHGYAADGNRVLKTAVDASNNQRHTVYAYSTLELRRTTFDGTDYVLNATTENVLLNGGVNARVVYSQEALPALMSGGRHLFLLIGDYLGSNTFIIDHETGELVEHSTYQAFGATESNYRPGRWGNAREPYKFTGKEEDVEVGLAYFGARYLSLGLGRWISADPATIHQLIGDSDPYIYASGRATVWTDPDGRILPLLAVVAIGMASGAAMSGGVYAITSGSAFTWGGLGSAMLVGAVSGAVGGGVGSIATSALAPMVGTVAAGLIGGAIGGAAGGGVGYGAGSAINGTSMTWAGFGQAVGIGAAAGFVTAGISQAISAAMKGGPGAPRSGGSGTGPGAGSAPAKAAAAADDLKPSAPVEAAEPPPSPPKPAPEPPAAKLPWQQPKSEADFQRWSNAQSVCKGDSACAHRVYTAAGGPPKEIALGKDIPGGGYKELAKQTGASPYRRWAEDGITRRTVDRNFGRAFHQAVKRADKIHFSLDGIDDPIAAAKAGAGGFKPNNMTNAELHYISNNPEALAKTIFYRGGSIVPSPF